MNKIKQRCLNFLSESEDLLKDISKLEKDDLIYKQNPSVFFPMVSCLTPQSYGAKIEKYIMLRLGAKKIQAKVGKGDILDLEYNRVEIKASVLKGKNKNTLNMVQIRLFSAVDYYLGVAINPKDIYSSYVFKLSHAQMKRECEKRGNNAHGTKEHNKNNKNKEIRLSVNLKKELPEWSVYRNKDYELKIFGTKEDEFSCV